MIRIQKLLADWGVASRRAVEKLITERQIIVNNEIISLGYSVDELNPPEIFVSGKKVSPPKTSDYAIYIFNKPQWVVSTVKDELGRKCISDYTPKGMRLYPAGRLDMDSTGFLLVTNYGELTNRLLHPSFEVEKEYIVSITGEPLTKEEESNFQTGIVLDDGLTNPCKLRRLKGKNNYSVILKEGRNRQVKRMFEFFERQVITLHRVRFGPLTIENVKDGEMRPLNDEERLILLKSTKLI